MADTIWNKMSEGIQKNVNTENVGNAMQVIGEGLKGFSAPFLGQTYTPSISMRQREKQKHEEILAQLRIDSTLGSRGFRRMSPEEVNEIKKVAQQSGFETTEDGAAMLPPGSKMKDGYIYDTGGDIIGEYLKGGEAKKGVAQGMAYRSGDYVSVGGTIYKFDLNLAMKMNRRTPAPQKGELHGMSDVLLKHFNSSGSQGGAPTFSAPDMERESMVGAIRNAMTQNVPQDEIYEGLLDEGYNPQDFQDVLTTGRR